VNLAAPVTFSIPSTRGTEIPMLMNDESLPYAVDSRVQS
jgi:hypothetical protein